LKRSEIRPQRVAPSNFFFFAQPVAQARHDFASPHNGNVLPRRASVLVRVASPSAMPAHGHRF